MTSTQSHRIIVGIDYGTTFSGISFVTTDKTSIEDIYVINTWPGQDAASAWKVPTRIAYPEENRNETMDRVKWGYQVHPQMVSCSWTKLLLDQKAEISKFDDPLLRTAIDKGILHLPHDAVFSKTANEVCSDFLHELHRYMKQQISRRIGENVLSATPMTCWITVPAVWSEKAQDATKRAAKKAGFGSGPNDQVYIISEPEAGAIATLKGHLSADSVNPPKKGEDILICDCGGGTVDIITYTIQETSPSLIFDEPCEGVGGKCGSTTIDRNLHVLMRKRFGAAFENVELRRRGPGSKFMNAWERTKRSFGMDGNRYPQELGPLRLEGVGESSWYDPEEGTVFLSEEDIQFLFDPVVDEIVRLVGAQNDELKKAQRKLDRLILLGGFGDSEYLFSKLKQWCKENGNIQALCHKDPQAAIVKGAALRGLEGTAPRIKRCRRHYGVMCWMPFRHGIDPPSRAKRSEWSGEWRCRGRIKWLVDKGEAVSANDTRESSFYMYCDTGIVDDLVSNLDIYCSSRDVAPDYVEDEGIQKLGTIRVDFTDSDIDDFRHKRKYGFIGHRHKWALDYQLKLLVGGPNNVIEFNSYVQDKLTGTTTIKFE